MQGGLPIPTTGSSQQPTPFIAFRSRCGGYPSTRFYSYGPSPTPYWDIVARVNCVWDAARLDPRNHNHRFQIPLRELPGAAQIAEQRRSQAQQCHNCFRQLEGWWWVHHFYHQRRVCADCSLLLELARELSNWDVGHIRTREVRQDIQQAITELRGYRLNPRLEQTIPTRFDLFDLDLPQ